MNAWEKRLTDLDVLLTNCRTTYYHPENFRRNVNQFLQTARTITFLIQKQKQTVPGFEAWYKEHVVEPWATDSIMCWARDSRNKIEKEGDLALHSYLRLDFIYSYLHDLDISLKCGREELLKADIERLVTFCKKQLPPGVSAAGIVKIARRWVCDSLPSEELVHALTYVYAQHRHCCLQLAVHLGRAAVDIPYEVQQFDPMAVDHCHTKYVKVAERGTWRVAIERAHARPPLELPQPFLALQEQAKTERSPDLPTIVARYAECARATFAHWGVHAPMLMIFDERWQCIELMTTDFADQCEKFLFWRRVGDCVSYLQPRALIWICEMWLRDPTDLGRLGAQDLPIRGEQLCVLGLDKSGRHEGVCWSIKRDPRSDAPSLEALPRFAALQHFSSEPSFWSPVLRAFSVTF